MTCDICNDDQFPAEIVNDKLVCTRCKASASFAAPRLLECCFGICADDPNWKCCQPAKWRNYFEGRPTDLVWCDEHKPTECQYPHVVEAL